MCAVCSKAHLRVVVAQSVSSFQVVQPFEVGGLRAGAASSVRRAGLHIQGVRPPAGMRIMTPAFQRIPGIGNRRKGGRRRHSEMEIAAEPRNDAAIPAP